MTLRLRRYALAFVVGFPGAIGASAIAAAMSRNGISDGAFPLGASLLILAGSLFALGVRSVIVIRPTDVTVRFFGLRRTTVRFDQLHSATFAMTFPSISFGLALVDNEGRRVTIHANWWQGEGDAIRRICRALLQDDVSMDRSTARVVSRALGVKRPKAKIIHRAVFRKDRTW